LRSPAPAAPRAVVVLKLDTLGDLIVFAPVLQCLRAAWPGTRLVVVIRRGYLDLAALLAPGIEWVGTTLDPFAQGPGADAAEVHRLRTLVSAVDPEVVAAATSRRTWLEVALAAAAPAARRLALGTSADDEFFATQLRVALGLTAAHVFSDQIPVPDDEPAWRENFRLADVLLARDVERVPPAIHVPDTAKPAADGFLASHHLLPRRFAVCAAAGFANVRLKTWPAQRFAALIRHVHERHGMPTVLIGHDAERAWLEAIVAQVSGASPAVDRAESSAVHAAPASALLWLGREGSLPELAALVAQSAFFLGNDTGAMHLAAALDVPVVGIFGGGTWPRFVPSARRGAAVVHPLPCFGCGWDCAFGNAPCVGEITVQDVSAAIDHALGPAPDFRVLEVQHLAAETRDMMGRAALRYRETSTGHLARQHKLEELTALSQEKDGEISSLKAVCDEREKTIFILDGHVRNLQAENAVIKADRAVMEKTLGALPADAAKAAQTIADQVVHIRNIESLLRQRENEIAEVKTSAAHRVAGLHDLEQAKHYGRLLAEKENAVQWLRESLAERERVIRELSAGTTGVTAALHKLGVALGSHFREKWWRPFDTWLFKRVVEDYWMQIGILRHYPPRPLKWDDRLPAPRRPDASLPQVAIVTPSYAQEKFLERTLRSVLDQLYPRLVYVVQDGASPDASADIIGRHACRLHHWESVKDRGQADAIHRGFAHVAKALGPDDVMAWLNSDDLLAPGSLRFVAEYFATHPEVDVIYGHRIIIDDDDREIGRWIMPRHNPATLEWIDYVPQETLFWRKRAWDIAGGIDPSFQFALDWDLLARFQQAGCRMVRVPYFLGAFRVHAEQKTSQAIHTTGADEMRRIRTRFHGERQDDFATINRHARHARFWGAITARLHEVGIRR
jgi:ADP-heptose:LPS heptosyltransferase/GT2 family glycosyltransferase